MEYNTIHKISYSSEDKMKKTISLVVLILIIFAVFSVNTFAATTLASGYCGGEGDGTNLTWTIDGDGTLTISGTGAMKNYHCKSDGVSFQYFTTAPWGEYRDKINTLVLSEGITTIGEYAFSECSNLKGELILPSTLTDIEGYAFKSCSGFTGDLIIPDSVVNIGALAFHKCEGFDGKLVISKNVTSIEQATFQSCYGLSGNLIIPEGVTKIAEYAFDYKSLDIVDKNCIGTTIPETITDEKNFEYNYGILIDNSSASDYGKLYLHELGMPDIALPIGNYTVKFDIYIISLGNGNFPIQITNPNWNGDALSQKWINLPNNLV